MSFSPASLRPIPADPIVMEGLEFPDFDSLDLNDTSPSGFDRFVAVMNEMPYKPRYPPLDDLPCANVQPDEYQACSKAGNKACSACKLVSYCSQLCQRKHWKIHKQDCRSYIRSEEWKAIWARENRHPSFLSDTGTPSMGEFQKRRNIGIDAGLTLWGNTPAFDLINLSANEKDITRDFNIAFAASGDLRHVVKTINDLPDAYTGQFKIVLNDRVPQVAVRNLMLLLILGTTPDKALAAEIALHYWYSVFIPLNYAGKYQPLGATSQFRLIQYGQREALANIVSYYTSPSFTVDMAQTEYNRIRNVPSREDFHDRLYANMRPSHRLAHKEFRRTLFSEDGVWQQTDFCDPLQGWDLTEVVTAGRRHGANSEDIYGCLYFFLTDQLRKFVERLDKFHITFDLFMTDGCALAEMISKGFAEDLGIPASTRFDRVSVSNILDVNYVGIHPVLTHWGPLLSDSKTAAIVGYFMNWMLQQRDGKASTAGEKAVKALIPKMLKHDYASLFLVSVDVLHIDVYFPFVQFKSRFPQPAPGHRFELGSLSTMMFSYTQDMDVVYDNSGPFAAYLKTQKTEAMLEETKLMMRQKHTIVPHRLGVVLDAPPSALPDFGSEENWYINVSLVSHNWSERFVEFARQ